MGVIADGIESADDAADRCTGNHVDGDARLLQHLQHTDVRHTLCATATEHDAHFLSLYLCTVCLRIGRTDH